MKQRITGHTELIGLMAYPIRHSFSPAMHNAAFEAVGADYAYLCFETGREELEDAIHAMRTLGMRGANISMPNKTAVGRYLDELTPAAKLCGAVNTIVNDGGRLTGYNTDGIGFMRSLRDMDADPVGKKITVAGCGGAGTAIEIQAALDGVAEISIFNIKDAFYANGLETVRKIRENTDCRAELYDLNDTVRLREELELSYMFVNATCTGMKPLEAVSVVPDPSFFRPELIVADAPYDPPCTRMREMAISAGCRTMNGLGMMLYQGAEAFRLWTGKEMPIEIVRDVLGMNTAAGEK